MLAESLLYRRESLNLSIADLSEMSGVSSYEYALLENPISHKMSIQTFEKLDFVMNLGDKFREEYVTPYLTFGQAIKDKRLEKGLSLGVLSKLSGIRRNYIWDLENGDKVRISEVLFKKLEKALEIEDSENFEPFLEKTTVHKIAFVNDGLFSELILKKRLELQLSQREVAKKANLDYSLLSKLEGGARTTMTTKNALKLMNTLRFTEEEKGRYLIKK